MKSFITLVLILPFLFLGCKKHEQPEMNPQYEECNCAHEVSAEFLMEEMSSFTTSAKYTNTDSIFSSKNVRFYGLEENAEYTWYIGTEIVTSREVIRYFNDGLVGQTLPIALVVKKTPNNICFPNDDGYDSIVKQLSVAQLPTYTLLDTTFLEGTYRMKSPLHIDSVDIIIDYRNYSNGLDKRIDIYNYDGIGSNCLNRIPRGGTNFRQFWTFGDNSVTQSDYLQGTVHHLLDGGVEMNLTTGGYVSGTYVTELNHFEYRGRKI
ncbi:hypothetical protein N9F08_00890 [bacterium]|nr:hypothetical protein [bacterium]